jgi:choloylglycine hydrolase
MVQFLRSIFILVLAASLAPPALACSSFRVLTEDGHNFFVFNFELGGPRDLIATNVVYYPKGSKFTGSAPEGRKPASWASKYAVVGMGWFDQPMLGGGTNEHGLSGANLNLPNYTKYQSTTKADDGNIIAGWDVPTYFLTQFKSVQEIRVAVQKVKVAFSLWKVRGVELPIEFHYTFHDPSGDSIVLEYIDGKPKVYDNKLGVVTNSPDFEWQRVNLNNYINLTTKDVAPKQVADVKLVATGVGSGMLGLPGDYTPPSRFVRTVALSQSALPAKSHAEGLQSAFRISNAISFPEGPARQIMGGMLLAGKTDFQLVADTSKRVMYFKDYDYPNWRSIDLASLAKTQKTKLVLDPSVGPAISSANAAMKNK